MERVSSVETAVHELRSRIDRGEKRLAIDGHRGADPSRVLNLLGDTSPASKRIVRVGLPDGDDAGMVALATMAAQLGIVSLDEAAPTGSDKAPKAQWKVLLAKVGDALRRHAKGLLLLIDRPRFDRSVAPQSELFEQQAVDVTDLLLGLPDATIVLAGAKSPVGFVRIGLEPLSLRDALATLPEALQRLLGGFKTTRRPSPSVLHTLAALVGAGGELQGLSQDLRPDKLFDELSGKVFVEDALRRVLARLCAFRLPFPWSELDRADEGSLSKQGRGFVEALLVTTAGDLVELPEFLRMRIRFQRAQGDLLWLGDDTADAHRFAADYHARAFESARHANDASGAIQQELEEIHHLTEAGDVDALLGRSVWFVEQYDALGKTLSQMALTFSKAGQHQIEYRLRREAISAYERALAHDGEDAYAHHYIAYNIDILATDPAKAEAEYQRARALRADHAWYHSRFICFLITRGRIAEALDSYREALDALDESVEDTRSYEELHGQVARLLLHAGELKLAREVLDDVPELARAASSGMWGALERLLAILVESRDERLVFPPSLPVERRWEGPHLVPDPRHSHIASWSPGCVVGSDRALHLRVANRDDAGREIISYMHISPKHLDEIVPRSFPKRPPTGTFVEIIRYRDRTETLLAYGRESSGIQIPDLPALFPRPDRYIRRASADA